jgi:hypothetical protein
MTRKRWWASSTIFGIPDMILIDGTPFWLALAAIARRLDAAEE